MKAAVCRDYKAPLTIEEIELAPPGPGEILVKLSACAICHSDVIAADGEWGHELPQVFGHEAAGVVTALGEGVEDLAVGEHVVVTLLRHCGTCHYCVQSKPYVCEADFALTRNSPIRTTGGEVLGQGIRTGAFAEAVTVHRSQAVAIPDDVPLDSAALLACGVITGLGAVVNTARVPAGASVAVIGCGGVGLNSIQGAALIGARTIIAIDLSDEKIAAARDFGATDGLNAASPNLAEDVRTLTGGRGVDYVFVTVGVVQAYNQALGLLAPGGSVIAVGMPASGAMMSFEPVNIADAAQGIIGSKMGSSLIEVDIPYLVELYQQDRIKLDELISGRFPLEEINDAIAEVKAGTALRNVIVFD